MSIIVKSVPGNRGVSHCNNGLELSVQPTTTPFSPVGESVSFWCLNRSSHISSHLSTSALSPIILRPVQRRVLVLGLILRAV